MTKTYLRVLRISSDLRFEAQRRVCDLSLFKQPDTFLERVLELQELVLGVQLVRGLFEVTYYIRIIIYA